MDTNEVIITRPSEVFSEIEFGDKRLTNRLVKTLEQMTNKSTESILGATNDRSSAKGFYRLLSNVKFSMDKLTEKSRKTTIEKILEHETVLAIQDTTDVNLNGHKKTKGLGYSSEHVLGVKVHSCIVVTPEGLSLGLLDQSYETREEAKSKLTKAEKAARSIEDKESYRWLEMLRDSTKDIPDSVNVITICDREGDFYELYAAALEIGKDFVIRVIHDRKTSENEKVIEKIRNTGACGQVTVNIPRDTRNNRPARKAVMEVACCSVNVLKPDSVHSENVQDSIQMNIVRITEICAKDEKEKIEWILATSLPVTNADGALKIVEYYVQRWKIERFHFVLKSGCKIEEIQQRSYEKITAVLFMKSVIAMFIMTITYIGRILPDIPCNVFFDDDEWKVLYKIVNKTKYAPDEPYSMADAVKYLGTLGSYKRSPSDGPPGLKSIWKGLYKLYDALDYVSSLNLGPT
jgi:hypothetical protein